MTRRRRRVGGLDVLVDPDRAEASLWRRFTGARDGALREKLFNHYRRFALALARRSARRSDVAENVLRDLEQSAFRGLLEAIDRFDPLRGPPFPAFAAPRINGRIADGLAEVDEARARLRFHRRVERERWASLAETERAGRSATDVLGDLVTELALGLMLDAEEKEAGSALAGRSDCGFDTLAWRETRALLLERVEQLPDMERIVVRQHYQHDLLFSQIATLLGLSKGRVSQIHKAALMKLRKSMRMWR
ncbi:sigma-70 family RNA polymerase sigma factor [Sphingomonas adhaesiva]|uniref:sigma-70 family RNA polymerase sigma factor n=1 Tax=Sphingomonas adhaesiva TaxID=28212 RepID=UPI002FFB613E